MEVFAFNCRHLGGGGYGGICFQFETPGWGRLWRYLHSTADTWVGEVMGVFVFNLRHLGGGGYGGICFQFETPGWRRLWGYLHSTADTWVGEVMEVFVFRMGSFFKSFK